MRGALKKNNPSPFLMVFTRKRYLALAVAVTAIFWIILNLIDQLLFFWPIPTFYLPEDRIVSFILSNLTAAAMGILTSMNVYSLKNLRAMGGSSVLSGSALGVASCACAGCSSLGVSLVSAFGSLGAAAFAFFAIYQIPLRILSLGALAWAYYSVRKTILSNMAKSQD